MKFVCEQCSTKYAIDDARVRGKILKIRCKVCQGVITVREQAESIPEGGSATETRQQDATQSTGAPPSVAVARAAGLPVSVAVATRADWFVSLPS